MKISNALRSELAPFNISVLIVEPSSFKTNILGAVDISQVSEPYKGTPAASMLNVIEKYRVKGGQRGDTVKAAKTIFESDSGDPASRLMGQVTWLPLGSNASKTLGWKIKMLKTDYV